MSKLSTDKIINRKDLQDYITSIIVGVIVGLFCLLFRYIIQQCDNVRTLYLTHSMNIYLKAGIYAVISFAVLSYIYNFIQRFPHAYSNGSEQARGLLMGSIKRENVLQRLMAKFIGACSTLGIGLSLGREGPSILFGSYIGIYISRIMKVAHGRVENIISAGASAGVVAALNAPLAGPVYIIESLQKINNYRIAMCSILAGTTAGIITQKVMPINSYKMMHIVVPDLNIAEMLSMFGIMGAFMSVINIIMILFIGMLRFGTTCSRKAININLINLSIGLALIGVFIPGLLGSGQSFMIEQLSSVDYNLMTQFILTLVTLVFVSYSQATGFPGGSFFPLLTLGGISGRLFGLILVHYGFADYQSLSFFMYLGMSSSFVIGMRTPLTGLLLVAEMTQKFELLFPSMIVGYAGFFIVSVIKLNSLPNIQYEMLIERINLNKLNKREICIEVMIGSYFDGRTTTMAGTPEGCVIKEIRRGNQKIEISNDSIFQPGDQIIFDVDTGTVGKVYQALECMGSGPN